MITIISPQSSIINIDDSSSWQLQWSSSITYSAYEIQYRKKGVSSWSTTGWMPYNATATDLLYQVIYDTYGLQFTEFEYRIKLQYNGGTSEGPLTGYEISKIYSIIFTPEIASQVLKIKTDDEIYTYPLFHSKDIEQGNTADLQRLSFNVDNETLVSPLVSRDSIMSSNANISTSVGIQTLATNQFNFPSAYTDTSILGEINQTVFYSYTVYQCYNAPAYYDQQYSYATYITTSSPAYYYAYSFSGTAPLYKYSANIGSYMTGYYIYGGSGTVPMYVYQTTEYGYKSIQQYYYDKGRPYPQYAYLCVPQYTDSGSYTYTYQIYDDGYTAPTPIKGYTTLYDYYNNSKQDGTYSVQNIPNYYYYTASGTAGGSIVVPTYGTYYYITGYDSTTTYYSYYLRYRVGNPIKDSSVYTQYYDKSYSYLDYYSFPTYTPSGNFGGIAYAGYTAYDYYTTFTQYTHYYYYWNHAYTWYGSNTTYYANYGSDTYQTGTTTQPVSYNYTYIDSGIWNYYTSNWPNYVYYKDTYVTGYTTYYYYTT